MGSNQNRFVLISDDDGATWRQIPLATHFNNTYLQTLGIGAAGRILASGGNGAVFVSDSEQLLGPNTPEYSVREGTTGMIPVERPIVPGDIEATYRTVAGTARANIDFVPTSGVLTWVAGDDEPKFVALETIDNTNRAVGRLLDLQIFFEDANGLVGQIDIPVDIEDDEGSGSPGITFEGDDNLYTSEAGGTAELLLSLGFPISQNVTVTVNGEDPGEGTLSQKVFTFTPSNRTIQQSLVITGVDDEFPDGDHSYDLIFSISSTDTNYDDLSDQMVSVTNIGDEAYEVGGEFLGDPVDMQPPPPRAAFNNALEVSLKKKIKKLKKKAKSAKRGGKIAKAKKLKVL